MCFTDPIFHTRGGVVRSVSAGDTRKETVGEATPSGYAMQHSARYMALKARHAPLFPTVQEFLNAAADYFVWVEAHPLLEEKVFQFQGAIVRGDQAKARPFTKTGLAQHLNISTRRLQGLRKRGEDWEEACDRIDDIMYTQKFENAAAGLMNATIIARDLGLADKQEVKADVTAAPATEEVPSEHLAIHIHPEDPDPLDLPRPLYSRAQLDAGAAFTAPVR